MHVGLYDGPALPIVLGRACHPGGLQWPYAGMSGRVWYGLQSLHHSPLEGPLDCVCMIVLTMTMSLCCIAAGSNDGGWCLLCIANLGYALLYAPMLHRAMLIDSADVRARGTPCPRPQPKPRFCVVYIRDLPLYLIYECILYPFFKNYAE